MDNNTKAKLQRIYDIQEQLHHKRKEHFIDPKIIEALEKEEQLLLKDPAVIQAAKSFSPLAE